MRRLLIVACVLLTPTLAHADATRECAAAAESAQLLRNSGKLIQAKEQLLMCVKTCRDIRVQNDCGEWMRDVDARMASIAVRATDPQGQEVTDVRVTIDGKVVATRLEANAIPVDPGQRKLVFERAGSPPVEQTVTIREGQKVRTVNVQFKAIEEASTVPIVPLVLGGVGVLALGTFAVYHLSAKSDLDTLRESCAPRCPQDEVDAVDRKIFVSNVALGIGIASLVGAAFVFFAGSTSGSTRVGAAPNGLMMRF